MFESPQLNLCQTCLLQKAIPLYSLWIFLNIRSQKVAVPDQHYQGSKLSIFICIYGAGTYGQMTYFLSWCQMMHHLYCDATGANYKSSHLQNVMMCVKSWWLLPNDSKFYAWSVLEWLTAREIQIFRLDLKVEKHPVLRQWKPFLYCCQ